MAPKANKVSLTYYNVLRRRAFIAFALVLILLIALASSIFILTSHNDTREETQSQASKIAEDIRQYFTQTVRICSYFSQFQTVSSSVLTKDNEYLSQSLLADNVTLFINRFDYIAGIEIEGDGVSISRGVVPENNFVYLGNYNPCDIYYSQSGQWPFYLKFEYPHTVHSKYDIHIYLYAHKLSRMVLTEGSYLVFSDKIVLSSNEALWGCSPKSISGYNQNNIVYMTHTVPMEKDIDVLIVHNSSDVLLQYGVIIILFLLVGILILSVILLIANSSFQKIYTPIGHVAEMIRYYVADDSDTALEQDIAYITQKLENVFASSTEKEQEVVTAMLQIKRSQIQALQSQISPHFISNILDSLKWMAAEKLGNDNELENHIVSLNNLLYHNIKQNETLVSLGEEISLCSNYLDLIQSCFTETIHAVWDVPPELLNCPIIKFTFQPLIENAVHHGFAHSQEGLCIRISARKVGENIAVDIENNGKEIDRKTLKEIKSNLGSSDCSSSHIGIQNVHLRIKLMFGESYGIQDIESSPSCTRICLLFPYDESYPSQR